MSQTFEEVIAPHTEAIRLDKAALAIDADDTLPKAGGFERELAMFRALSPDQKTQVLDVMQAMAASPKVAAALRTYFAQRRQQ